MESKTLLILAAHPDDTEFLAGGAVARFVKEGYEAYHVIATDGGRGSFELEPEELIRTREREAEKAAKALGIKDVISLGYPDGYLNETPLNKLREQFIRLIRRYKPQIVITWDQWARFEFHPDHRHVSEAAMEALFFSRGPLFHPEHRDEGLEPHLVADRYYFAKDNKLCDTVIDITDFMETKIDALCAHVSQLKLMIDDLTMTIKALGAADDMLAKIDRENYRGLLELMIKSRNGQIGARAGYTFGEEFRYERCGGPIAEAALRALK